MNRDFVDMLSALSAAGAEYLVVGAHAMAVHGLPRATGDLDIWVRPTTENARKVFRALAEFGAPLGDLTVEDLGTPALVFQIGVPPCRIDIMTEIDGVTFEQAWQGSTTVTLSNLSVPVLGRRELLINKRASRRPKDLADIAWLESEEE
ncbi:MAG: hypothetical protein AB1486_12675 [Planctomycetota bacterium]